MYMYMHACRYLQCSLQHIYLRHVGPTSLQFRIPFDVGIVLILISFENTDLSVANHIAVFVTVMI